MLHKSKLHTQVLKYDIVLSWPVRFDDVLYGPATDGTTSVNLSLEPQPAVMTQTHVSTRVDDGVHLMIKAHCTLVVLVAQGGV